MGTCNFSVIFEGTYGFISPQNSSSWIDEAGNSVVLAVKFLACVADARVINCERVGAV